MSSYFDEASLVFIPSGYKTSKAYSVKPTDGSGDLVVSRSNDTATRVGPDGLIEKVRTNIYPKNIGLLSGYTLGANATDGGQVEGPTGLMDARRIVMSVASNAFVNLTMTLPAAGQYTFSVWVKLVSGTPLNSPVQYSGLGVNVFMNALPTSTWSRVYGTVTVPSAGSFTLVHPFYDSVATIDYAQVQIETGDIATDYIATTSAAVSVGPVANVPRLDYLNSSCGRLLLEPQRTNLIQYSEQFNNAWWSPSNSTISANAVASPDGYTNADNLVENTANSTHVVGNVSGLTLTAAAYTFSVFVKKQNRNFFAISTYDGSSTLEGYFNINTGAVATMPVGLTGTITSYGNGWYRCSVTRTMGANANNYFSFNAAATDGGSTYTGTGVVACSIYGASLELGAYATSYIPTLGAAVTRGADAMALAALNNADMTFTAFLELEEVPLGGGAADWLNIRNSAVLGRAFGYANQFGFADAYNLAALSKTKMVWKQESGTTAKIFGDGALLGTSTSGTYSTPFTIFEIIGSSLIKPLRIKQFIFFANNISDADCIALTA